MDKVVLAEKFAAFSDTWSPKLVGEVNNCQVKLVKLQGEFVWHQHAEEDELFLVIKGHLLLKLRDRDITLHAGEFFIVPRGIEHLPIADEECHVLLLKPNTTLNTGNITNERTVSKLGTV
jgi:quercetin dioxygenase-like cupin family protein